MSDQNANNGKKKPLSHRTRFSIFVPVNDVDYRHLDQLPISDPRYRVLNRPHLRAPILDDDKADVLAIANPGP